MKMEKKIIDKGFGFTKGYGWDEKTGLIEGVIDTAIGDEGSVFIGVKTGG